MVRIHSGVPVFYNLAAPPPKTPLQTFCSAGFLFRYRPFCPRIVQRTTLSAGCSWQGFLAPIETKIRRNSSPRSNRMRPCEANYTGDNRGVRSQHCSHLAHRRVVCFHFVDCQSIILVRGIRPRRLCQLGRHNRRQAKQGSHCDRMASHLAISDTSCCNSRPGTAPSAARVFRSHLPSPSTPVYPEPSAFGGSFRPAPPSSFPRP